MKRLMLVWKWVPDFMVVAGTAALVRGAFLWSEIAGYTTLGLMLLGGAWLLSFNPWR